MKKRILLIELNEFSEDLLKLGAYKLKLRNIKKLLHLNSRDTTSLDENEHYGLDPWVQWVSIHTGKPSEEHKVKHLGDVVNLKKSQIWEKLGDLGYSTGLWGVMNGSLKKTKYSYFYLPDPWTITEKAKPQKLNKFLSLPRYYAQNYLEPSKKLLMLTFLDLLKFILSDWNFIYLRNEIIYALKVIFFNGLNNTILFGLFDLISHKIFIKYKINYDPNLSIIFLNCLAHAQHDSWTKNKIKKDMKIILEIVDMILSNFFEIINQDEAILVMNGLGQKNVEDKDYCIYRQKNPKSFLNFLGVKFDTFQQCMTNESHLFFKSKNNMLEAFKILDNIYISNEKLFYVELSEKNFSIFYQVNIFHKIFKEEYFLVKNKKHKFYKYFVLLADRTGAHIPKGRVFYKNILIEKLFYNYEIHDLILDFFKKE